MECRRLRSRFGSAEAPMRPQDECSKLQLSSCHTLPHAIAVPHCLTKCHTNAGHQQPFCYSMTQCTIIEGLARPDAPDPGIKVMAHSHPCCIVSIGWAEVTHEPCRILLMQTSPGPRKPGKPPQMKGCKKNVHRYYCVTHCHVHVRTISKFLDEG